MVKGVNVAARLEGLADPGGILISGKIYAEVEGKVEADFEDRGEQQVKNITRPIRIYAVRTARAAGPVGSNHFRARQSEGPHASRQAIDRRPSIPEHVRRSRARILRRRHGGRHHYCAVAVQVLVRDRP